MGGRASHSSSSSSSELSALTRAGRTGFSALCARSFRRKSAGVSYAPRDASGFHRLLQLLGIHSRKLVALLLVAVVLGVALKRQHPRNRALATPEARFLDERFEPIGRARVDADARDLVGALLRVGRSFGRRGLLAGGGRRGRRPGRRRLRFGPASWDRAAPAPLREAPSSNQ